MSYKLILIHIFFVHIIPDSGATTILFSFTCKPRICHHQRRERKVVHLQIQAYESSTVDRKEMIHKAGFVDPGQLTFSHGGVWWVLTWQARELVFL